MTIDIPKKPVLEQFELDSENLFFYKKFKKNTNLIILVLFIVISSILTMIFRSKFEESNSLSGYFLAFFIIVALQFNPICVIVYISLAKLILRLYLGWDKTRIIKDIKENSERYDSFIRYYDRDALRYSENNPEVKQYQSLEEYRIEMEKIEEEKQKESRRIELEKKIEEERILQENEIKRREYLKEIDYWISLTGYEFEREVCDLYKRIGYKSILTKGSGDGGVDIILYDNDQNKIVVQCKNHNKQISPAIARELYGVMIHEEASRAILICPSGFSRAVNSFSHGKPIELIDGKELLKLYHLSLESQNSNSP
jgi:HJR/Mrr/RecB family endonuclease